MCQKCDFVADPDRVYVVVISKYSNLSEMQNEDLERWWLPYASAKFGTVRSIQLWEQVVRNMKFYVTSNTLLKRERLKQINTKSTICNNVMATGSLNAALIATFSS